MLYNDAQKFIEEQFYTGTYDPRSALRIDEIVGRNLVELNRSKDPDYYDHREGVVHATSLAKCLRGVALQMAGAKPDGDFDQRKLGIFMAGNRFEEFIINSLGDRVVERQREYVYPYKNIVLTGRSDWLMDDHGIMRIGECKSVNSRMFWHSKKDGTLVKWYNQIQLQVYMWLERELYGHGYEGIFAYVSKDDVTIVSTAIKYNPEIIKNVVMPALDILNDAYVNKDPMRAPVPPLVQFSPSTGKYEPNWLCKYCGLHDQCAGTQWVLETEMQVQMQNKVAADLMKNPYAEKKVKPSLSLSIS